MGFNPNKSSNNQNGTRGFQNNKNNQSEKEVNKNNGLIVPIICGIVIIGIIIGIAYFFIKPNKKDVNKATNEKNHSSTEMIEIEILNKKDGTLK